MSFQESEPPVMKASNCHQENFESIKCLLLELAQARSVPELLARIVEHLAGLGEVALARIWILAPGDICEECHFRSDCPDRSVCLHLIASAGTPLEQGQDWSRTHGRFRRFPIGFRKIGHIAASREPVLESDLNEGSRWIADPDWARSEGIRGFVGLPLLFRDELLGVLGVFLRGKVVEDALTWLRMVADHAAVAIANARAFEEIDRLRTQLELENEFLRDEVRDASGCCGEIIGRSPRLKKVLQQVELVAPTESSVLILGESGVGKELIARAVHENSRRSKQPLIKVNCASIPGELFESEFFGHVRGSFTGAVRDRAGRFELADGGTLFLDEVGEIPLDMQGKLLRVLQDGTYERIGEERTRQADVRIIAATNRDLEAEVAAKRFRQDLYYRLSVFPIDVIPLRQRKQDIPLLVASMLETQSRKLGVPTPTLKRRHLLQLERYDWPGNIRELQNVVERSLIRARSSPLAFELPAPAVAGDLERIGASTQAREPLTDAELRRFERDNLLEVLKRVRWRISGRGGAAEFLGLHPATLASRMKAMGLVRQR